MLFTAVVLAQGSLDLEWSAPAGCPTIEVARARIGPLTGQASVVITERASEWALVVKVGPTERQLVTQRCEEAADAAVLIIQLGLRPRAPDVTSTGAPDAGNPVPPPEPVEPAPTPLHFQLGPTASVVFGWLPQPLVRFGLGFTVRRDALVLLAHLQTALVQRYLIDGSADGAARVQVLGDLDAGACWSFPVGPARLSPCLLGGAALVSVVGENLVTARQATVLAPHLSPGARVSLELTSWLEASLSGWARVGAFPVVTLEESREVVRGNLVGGEAVLGIGGVW